MLFIIGLLMLVGICNDTATFTQIIGFSFVGFVIMLLAVLFTRHTHYRLDFTTPSGKTKTVIAYNLASRLLAKYVLCKYGNYTLQTEWEIVR